MTERGTKEKKKKKKARLSRAIIKGGEKQPLCFAELFGLHDACDGEEGSRSVSDSPARGLFLSEARWHQPPPLSPVCKQVFTVWSCSPKLHSVGQQQMCKDSYNHTHIPPPPPQCREQYLRGTISISVLSCSSIAW